MPFNDSDCVHNVQAALEASAVKQQLSAIFESMPRDLQQTMLSSPHRAALLQGSGPHAKVSHLSVCLMQSLASGVI